ncbi:PIN domain-containing protein [Rhodopila sp.]|uniref:PIN domain-containing protein n=1 Tax=Rhodopila sp. TaxID=2480087 RepID=UPI003D0DEE3E
MRRGEKCAWRTQPRPRRLASAAVAAGRNRLRHYPHYARVRALLERQGMPIGANDTWIAAQALAINATLVSDNEREFSRVPGLPLENWLARGSDQSAG